jgi:hypothetical protein
MPRSPVVALAHQPLLKNSALDSKWMRMANTPSPGGHIPDLNRLI